MSYVCRGDNGIKPRFAPPPESGFKFCGLFRHGGAAQRVALFPGQLVYRLNLLLSHRLNIYTRDADSILMHIQHNLLGIGI